MNDIKFKKININNNNQKSKFTNQDESILK